MDTISSDDLAHMKESLAIAEQLATASMLTTSSAKRRLQARQLQISTDAGEYVPPKHVLLYLVRMGSFTSSQVYNNDDNQDDHIILPKRVSADYLLTVIQRGVEYPLPIDRSFRYFRDVDDGKKIRVMQWNMLSQTIGLHYDKFARTPNFALDWNYRRFLILKEILTYKPSIICLQEVDHFQFLLKTLSTQDYDGIFYPKPDSPCQYIKDNNGPDGCAIFYDKSRFTLLQSESIILPVWTIKSNQVAIKTCLRDSWTGRSLCVCTTHLKARSSALMSSIRHEQGRALLEWLGTHRGAGGTALVCGDFNGEPHEAVYQLMCSSASGLCSAYGDAEPPFTTWKIRQDGEHKQTLDYVFYTEDTLTVNAVLEMPVEEDIGMHRLPSNAYPSDHISLVCDLSFK